MKHEFVSSNWRWLEGELSQPAIRNLLAEHQARMSDYSPPESRHVLGVEALKQPEITFWSLWDGDKLMGCVALKHCSDAVGEIKSMKITPAMTGKGIGKRLLEHVINTAGVRGYQQLKLETGSMDYFEPARKLYSQYGFQYCGPFGNYTEDSNNVFMSLDVSKS